MHFNKIKKTFVQQLHRKEIILQNNFDTLFHIGRKKLARIRGRLRNRAKACMPIGNRSRGVSRALMLLRFSPSRRSSPPVLSLSARFSLTPRDYL